MLEVWREVRQDVELQALWAPLIADVREWRASLPAIDGLSWQTYEELSWQVAPRFPDTLAYHGPLLAIFVVAHTQAIACGEWPAWTPWQAMRLEAAQRVLTITRPVRGLTASTQTLLDAPMSSIASAPLDNHGSPSPGR
jgi:hypothetical protein